MGRIYRPDLVPDLVPDLSACLAVNAEASNFGAFRTILPILPGSRTRFLPFLAVSRRPYGPIGPDPVP